MYHKSPCWRYGNFLTPGKIHIRIVNIKRFKSTIVLLSHINKLITTKQFSKGQVVTLFLADCDLDNKIEVLLIAELRVTFCSELDVTASVIFR